MSALGKLAADSAGRAGLRRAPDGDVGRGAVLWRINGYRAKLLIWTQNEWEELKPRPPDAQHHPCGLWCALRLEESH